MNFTAYPRHLNDELIARYAIVHTELSNLNIELADLFQQEHELKYRTWQESTEQTVNGRDRDSTIATVTITNEIHKVRGEIQALKGEQTLIEFIIQERTYGERSLSRTG